MAPPAPLTLATLPSIPSRCPISRSCASAGRSRQPERQIPTLPLIKRSPGRRRGSSSNRGSAAVDPSTAAEQQEPGSGAFVASAVRRAAFFDVDGTLVDSNIVLPYVLVRLRELPPPARLLWAPYFALKCIYFIALDAVDRGAFNRVFYRHYAGRDAGSAGEQAQYVYREYLQPKIYPGARERVAQLKADGYDIVLVTGSLDFLMQPLADELGADHVIAAALDATTDGRYTGELRGAPVVASEKVARMAAYAAERGMDMAACCAYSDSMSDMPMLEAVGTAAVVGPGTRLRKEAQARAWEVLDWRPQ